jgi:hypothetical protein
VIARYEVMPLLLDSCPSFAAGWSRYQSSATYEPGLLYIDLGELVHHVVDLLRAGRTDELAGVFAVVERLHLEGDTFVREAATIGFLETLQNYAGNSGIEPERFRVYLGPESARWWDELDRFWAGEVPFLGAGLEKPED